MMYKVDHHALYDNVNAHTDLRTEKDVDLIVINRPQIWAFGNDADFEP